MKKNSINFRKIVWMIFLIGGGAVSVASDLLFFKSLFANVTFHVVTFTLGIFLLRAVVAVARNTGKTLAKYGKQGDVPRFETNKLVTRGVYSKMRHPMHLGLFFFPLSVAFILGSPTFIFIIAPLEAFAMFIMVKFFEEKEAVEKFGEEYENYMRNVPGFCFKPDCIKALFEEPE